MDWSERNVNKLLIRADGNNEIGSGHIIRCSAIAAEAEANGCEAVFAVSDEASRALVAEQGFRSEVLGGDFREFTTRDANELTDLANRLDVGAVLVDSYAVNDSFFAQLARSHVACAYIDDAYTFEAGSQPEPIRRDVAAIINYSFGSDPAQYDSVYSGSPTSLAIGPRFAPVRRGFRGISYAVESEVKHVLVTSGMTNPNGVLERMVSGCHAALPKARVTVVVGGLATFDSLAFGEEWLRVVENPQNMQELMAACDLAVSAAGTTLYELTCIGVPYVAAPIVDNQVGNAKGIEGLKLGYSLGKVAWGEKDVEEAVSVLAETYELRRQYSFNGKKAIDGLGAARIYKIVNVLGCSSGRSF